MMVHRQYWKSNAFGKKVLAFCKSLHYVVYLIALQNKSCVIDTLGVLVNLNDKSIVRFLASDSSWLMGRLQEIQLISNICQLFTQPQGLERFLPCMHGPCIT